MMRPNGRGRRWLSWAKASSNRSVPWYGRQQAQDRPQSAGQPAGRAVCAGRQAGLLVVQPAGEMPGDRRCREARSRVRRARQSAARGGLRRAASWPGSPPAAGRSSVPAAARQEATESVGNKAMIQHLGHQAALEVEDDGGWLGLAKQTQGSRQAGAEQRAFVKVGVDHLRWAAGKAQRGRQGCRCKRHVQHQLAPRGSHRHRRRSWPKPRACRRQVVYIPSTWIGDDSDFVPARCQRGHLSADAHVASIVGEKASGGNRKNAKRSGQGRMAEHAGSIAGRPSMSTSSHSVPWELARWATLSIAGRESATARERPA